MRFTKARKGAVVLKVDLDKAYDRIEWGFVEKTLEDARLPRKLVYVIMQIISSGSCRLIWNWEATDSIKPSRGLRQGDPLSPCIFVLCLERLGHLLQMTVNQGQLRLVRASRRGPVLSYVFFADDLILFSEAKENQLLCIKEGLEMFCKSSG